MRANSLFRVDEDMKYSHPFGKSQVNSLCFIGAEHKNLEIIAQLFLPIDLHQFIMGDGLILRVCAICVLGMVSAGFLMD